MLNRDRAAMLLRLTPTPKQPISLKQTSTKVATFPGEQAKVLW